MTAPKPPHDVNFAAPRSFGKVLKTKLKESLFPDDPFAPFKKEPPACKTWKIIQYFVPILDWLPKYSLGLFKFDLLAGITIASMAIPQGISYANLAKLPPIIGLYSSFVPPIIYTILGTSKHLAVGTVAACSLLIAESIGEKVSYINEPELYLHLVYTATLVSGLFQTALGLLRLGILVDFLSHSTIIGFMGGTALLICLQQLRGLLGMKHFTNKTGVVDVLHAVFKFRNEWQWRCFVMGIAFLIFLQITKFIKEKKPKLFWVSAIAPIIVVISGCLFAYFEHAERLGIPIVVNQSVKSAVGLTSIHSHSGSSTNIVAVGHLKKGINGPSIHLINFDGKYIMAPIKAGIITGLIALAEGIAIGRSFAIKENKQIDGNKEMIALGVMNIVGSLTSCYLTTGPFSKTAVNYNAGCKTQMSNLAMAVVMMLVLLFLAPVFSYTPQVALSAIIMSAMFGLLEYQKFLHLYQSDKFDFLIAISGFFGVSFISMDIGLMISVGLALVRALLYIARPATCKLHCIPQTNLYRDVEQYPDGQGVPGILILQLGSPIYFATSTYICERILRWVRDEQALTETTGNEVEYVLLELGGVTAIDITGVDSLLNVRRNLESKGIKMIIVNPRLEVMEKLIVTKFINKIGKEYVFLSVEDAVEFCKFSFKRSNDQSHERDEVTL